MPDVPRKKLKRRKEISRNQEAHLKDIIMGKTKSSFMSGSEAQKELARSKVKRGHTPDGTERRKRKRREGDK